MNLKTIKYPLYLLSKLVRIKRMKEANYKNMINQKLGTPKTVKFCEIGMWLNVHSTHHPQKIHEEILLRLIKIKTF